MGLSGDSKKKGKGKRGNAVLEAFTMMKSDDGWDDDDSDDEYYVKGGARWRKEIASGEKRSRSVGNKKESRKKRNGMMWK